MKMHCAVLVAALALSGCARDLSPTEVNEMLFQPSHGLMAGIDFGDGWEKIKADHDKRYTVRDEVVDIASTPTPYYQLRHDLGSPGDDGFYVNFALDAEKKVKSYSVSIYGRKRNAVVVREVLDEVIAHFDKKVGGGHCAKMQGGQGNSTNCDWRAKDRPRVAVMYMEMSDPITGIVDITISPPSKE
jgi:hypothetical protein